MSLLSHDASAFTTSVVGHRSRPLQSQGGTATVRVGKTRGNANPPQSAAAAATTVSATATASAKYRRDYHAVGDSEPHGADPFPQTRQSGIDSHIGP